MSSFASPDSGLSPLVDGVSVSEDWTAGIGGGVWTTALIIANYFDRRSGYLQRTLKGGRCLEVGSGNGWLSCVLAAVVPSCTVVATDTKEHVPLMRGTVEKNEEGGGRLEEGRGRVTAEELLWGEQELGGTFDFIFGE